MVVRIAFYQGEHRGVEVASALGIGHCAAIAGAAVAVVMAAGKY